MQKLYLISVIFLSVGILSYGASKRSHILRTSEKMTAPNIETDTIPKRNKKDKIAEDIQRLLPPVPASFSSADSAALIANWTIGIKFYKANCAKCHGIFGKGKDSIPNFSKEQMDDYKSGLLAQDKLNHAVMANMTANELDAVFLFITDIKR
jgi:mono/diheme cytochrome c family protein